jgi:protease IV
MLRKLFRWIVRAVIAVLVLLLLAVVTDYFQHRVAPGSVLVVELKGPVVERASGLFGLLTTYATPLNLVRRAIDRATRDPRIDGLALKVIDPEMSLAQAQEIAAMVEKFGKSGKWTAAYLETAGEGGPGNLPYVVAAASGEVAMMPEGELNLIGVGMRELFARGTLDWLGIRPNFAAIGKFKTAANMATEKDFTPAQREEDEAMVGDMYDQIVAAISSERHLTPDAVRALVDQAPFGAAAGAKLKLVDRLEYEDEFDDSIKKHGGGKHALLDYEDYTRPRLWRGFGVPDRIAVVYGLGVIERSSEGFNPLAPGGEAMTPDDLAKAFEDIRDDDRIRAVVFRVDSPGGSALASELIRREVELTAKKKPVVVSMSGVAASGGYWVSASARKIFADPGTLTGSIGVLGGKFNITPAAQKIFLNTGAVTRGANIEMFDEFTDFTPAQMKLFQDNLLGETYQYFLKLVAAGRHMNVEEVDQVAQGRVWTGEQAVKVKLVDGLGGFDAAFAEAKRLAHIAPGQPVGLVELPELPSPLQMLLSGRLGAQGAAARGRSIDSLEPVLQAIEAALHDHGLVRAAYCPVVPIF